QGVSGTGKSTLGAALSGALNLPFIDGDDLHPAANVAKMARGEALGDGDREPWLERIRGAAIARVMDQSEREGAGRLGVIVACSALKKAYREVLRGEGELATYFVYLEGEREVLMARMERREGHFMKAGMLASQLDTLESPEGEPGVVTVDVTMSTAEQVKRVVELL
ncbi:carbohydrate kinase, partial [Imleria badia]